MKVVPWGSDAWKSFGISTGTALNKDKRQPCNAIGPYSAPARFCEVRQVNAAAEPPLR